MSGSLDRFLKAQEGTYEGALLQIKSGRKTGHWMWYMFPQIDGLGYSETSKYYSIKDMDEAKAYLGHPILGFRLKEMCKVLLSLDGSTALQIFGSPDNLKLRSSMTLFAQVNHGPERFFEKVIDKYFEGRKDERTMELLELE